MMYHAPTNDNARPARRVLSLAAPAPAVVKGLHESPRNVPPRGARHPCHGGRHRRDLLLPASANLLNELGHALRPKVRCIINLANAGAGLPDGGLFTPDQFPKASAAEPREGQSPAHGGRRSEAALADLRKIARSEQVQRYSAKYGLVLLTNLCEFLLLGRDAQGGLLPMESYVLAADEAAFWALAAHPQKAADAHGAALGEYLKRVMLSSAPLTDPKDVAWFLASYARTAKARVEAVDVSALAPVRDALQEALGMKFTGERGEHFFRSTLVQTIFYGVFSAWVLWHRERPERMSCHSGARPVQSERYGKRGASSAEGMDDRFRR